MKTKKLSDADLAEMLGRDRSRITRYRLGAAVPPLAIAVQIAAISKGKVPVTSWVMK